MVYAYDATNLATMLYSSSQGGSRDQAGLTSKFLVPTIAKGRVYVGTQTEVDVYGLFSQTPPVPNQVLSSLNLTFTNQPVGSSTPVQSVTLANTGTGTTSISTITTTEHSTLAPPPTPSPYSRLPLYP